MCMTLDFIPQINCCHFLQFELIIYRQWVFYERNLSNLFVTLEVFFFNV